MLIWGSIEPYLIDKEEELAGIPGLPPAWEEKQVALIADWQIGMWLNNTSTILPIRINC
jgi:hypothetical protein